MGKKPFSLRNFKLYMIIINLTVLVMIKLLSNFPKNSLIPSYPALVKRFIMTGGNSARSIHVGDRVPVNVNFMTVEKLDDGTCARPIPLPASDLFAPNKTVVLVSIPGAFTPVCSSKHIPGFITKAREIRAAGADTIACMAVNDAFVLGAWMKELGGLGSIKVAADGNAEFSKAIGMDADFSSRGLGVRSKRFAMIVRNGEVRYLGIDGEDLKESHAEAVLAFLQSQKK
jgi:glutaredoxin/glutathione-dependent peroxiredoxin